MNSKIAILGGAGFLGTRFANRLEQSTYDFGIYDIDISNGSTVFADVEDSSSLEAIKDCSVIVNLAAVHRDDIKPISRYDDVNVNGAINVCNIARKYGIKKIIFTSSVAVYGFAKANTDENGDHNYFNDYGRTKHLAELIYKEWHDEDPDDRMLFIVRPTVIFGEGNRGNVYNLLSQIARRRFIMFGKGTNKKSMAYVENVASFLEYTCNFENGYHVYNYIDKPDFNMNELVSKSKLILFGKEKIGIRLPAWLGTSLGIFADILAMILGKKLPISSIRVKKFMSTTQFSTSISDTFFVPPISIEKGLENTLKYEFIEDNSGKRKFYSE